MSAPSDIPILDEETCRDLCVNPGAVLPLLDRLVDAEGANRIAAFFGSMADPTRVRILQALSVADELCVHDISLLVGVSESAISHQLRTLRDGGVVTRRRDGRTMLYRLTDQHIDESMATAIAHAEEGR